MSANTAVYQSASAVVFIISVPVLRERVTLLKVFSVIFTVAGVSMVSVFTQDRNPAHINSTLPSTGMVRGVACDDVAATDSTEKTTPIGYVVSSSSKCVQFGGSN